MAYIHYIQWTKGPSPFSYTVSIYRMYTRAMVVLVYKQKAVPNFLLAAPPYGWRADKDFFSLGPNS